jgi:ABC-2 type transport system permease protein
MNKYYQIISLFWQSAIAAELEYRLNFVMASVTSVLNLSGSIFSLFLFYRTGYTFEGWSWEAALVVLGMFTLLQGFSAIFLIPNLNKIVTHVQEGTLDFILLKPINSQFWLSTRMVSPWGFPDVFFGLIILIYAGQKLHLNLSQYGLTIIPLSLGMISLYSIWFILGATSIWFVKIYNVTEVLRGLLEAGRFPMAAYPAAYRFFFTFIIPVAFLTTIPAETMLGKVHFIWLFLAAILAGGLFLFSRFFWSFALKFYTSASS